MSEDQIRSELQVIHSRLTCLLEAITGTADGKTRGMRSEIQAHAEHLASIDLQIAELRKLQSFNLIKLAAASGGVGATIGGVASQLDIILKLIGG